MSIQVYPLEVKPIRLLENPYFSDGGRASCLLWLPLLTRALGARGKLISDLMCTHRSLRNIW